jgi:hypothetical protein
MSVLMNAITDVDHSKGDPRFARRTWNHQSKACCALGMSCRDFDWFFLRLETSARRNHKGRMQKRLSARSSGALESVGSGGGSDSKIEWFHLSSPPHFSGGKQPSLRRMYRRADSMARFLANENRINDAAIATHRKAQVLMNEKKIGPFSPVAETPNLKKW